MWQVEEASAITKSSSVSVEQKRSSDDRKLETRFDTSVCQARCCGGRYLASPASFTLVALARYGT